MTLNILCVWQYFLRYHSTTAATFDIDTHIYFPLRSTIGAFWCQNIFSIKPSHIRNMFGILGRQWQFSFDILLPKFPHENILCRLQKVDELISRDFHYFTHFLAKGGSGWNGPRGWNGIRRCDGIINWHMATSYFCDRAKIQTIWLRRKFLM